MSKAENIERSIKAGLGFIGRNQLENGGFISYCSQDQNNFTHDKEYETTFFPSLTGLALKEIEDETARKISLKIIQMALDSKKQLVVI